MANDNAPVFERIKRVDESGNEYWNAQDMAKALAYAEFRNFRPVIDRGKKPGGIANRI